jgi:hypothetical protein
VSFAGLIERQQTAVFETLGEDATWTGVTGTVRIRRREEDEEPRFADARHIARSIIIRVRRSQVPHPADGDTVTLLAGGAFVLIAAPVLDAKGVWRCEAAAA